MPQCEKEEKQEDRRNILVSHALDIQYPSLGWVPLPNRWMIWLLFRSISLSLASSVHGREEETVSDPTDVTVHINIPLQFASTHSLQ